MKGFIQKVLLARLPRPPGRRRRSRGGAVEGVCVARMEWVRVLGEVGSAWVGGLVVSEGGGREERGDVYVADGADLLADEREGHGVC